jgi:hypothetical protein
LSGWCYRIARFGFTKPLHAFDLCPLLDLELFPVVSHDLKISVQTLHRVLLLVRHLRPASSGSKEKTSIARKTRGIACATPRAPIANSSKLIENAGRTRKTRASKSPEFLLTALEALPRPRY